MSRDAARLSAVASATAAPICARWVRPCGKFPSNSPLCGSTSSENRPRSLATRSARSYTARASLGLALVGETFGEPERTARGTRPPDPAARRRGGSDTAARRRRRAPRGSPPSFAASARRASRRTRRSAAAAALRRALDGRTPERTRRACGHSRAARSSREARRGPAASGGPAPGACTHRRAGSRGRAPTSTETFECTKWSGSPGHSQIPRSGSSHCSAAWSISDTRKRQSSSLGRMPAAVPAPRQVDELSVGVELALAGASLPIRTGVEPR